MHNIGTGGGFAVAPEEWPPIINNIAGFGNEMFTKAKEVYEKIDNMKNECWYGGRYNDTVQWFIDLKPTFKSVVESITDEVIIKLEQIADNYQKTDRNKKAIAESQAKTVTIPDLTKGPDQGTWINPDRFDQAVSDVNLRLRDMKQKLVYVLQQIEKLPWEGNARETFIEKYKKYKADLDECIDKLNSEFTKNSSQDKADYMKAEKANTMN